jgi:glycosyltransferase involved in cell wall biosynthesis
LSWKKIIELNSKYPIVFTLHDSRLFTGGCHFDLECGRFNSGCSSCPAVIGPKKIISFSKESLDNHIGQLTKYSVVSPSQWLLELGKSSRLVQKSHQAMQVSNIVNTGNVISSMAVKSEKRNIYFVAANPTAPVKGLALLLKALDEDFCGKYNLRIVIVGGVDSRLISQMKKLDFVQIAGGKSNHEVMKGAKFGDFLVVPSNSENSPNVISEAQLTGLIVIASAVGGIPELVKDGDSGFLFQRTIQSVRSAVLRAMEADTNLIRENARRVATVRNNEVEIVDKHRQIYLALTQ